MEDEQVNEPYTGLVEEPVAEPEVIEEEPVQVAEAPAPTAEPVEKTVPLTALQDERRKRQALERELEQARKLAEPKMVIAGKPTVDAFDTYEDYVEAVADWKAEEKFKARESATRQQTVEQGVVAKIEAAHKTYSDYEEVTNNMPDVSFPDVVLDAIKESDNTADLLYFFSKNHGEAERISRLSPIQQVKEIGRLETKFEKAAPAQPVKRLSQAPEPITPVSAKNNIPPDPDNLSDDEWLKQERERLRKQGRLY